MEGFGETEEKIIASLQANDQLVDQIVEKRVGEKRRTVEKGPMELNVKINILSIRPEERAERIKEVLKEMEEVKREYPSAKISIEVNA